MTCIYTIEILGKMRGKDRPRSTKNGHHYTPHETVAAESWIREEVLRVVTRDFAPVSAPVRLAVYVGVAIPASFSKARRLEAEMGISYPTVKPDFDNMLKLIADALNGIIWMDDKQVVRGSIEKFYSPVPKTTLVIEILN